MDARVMARFDRAIREAYAKWAKPGTDWVALRLIAAELPGVSKATLATALADLERRDEVVLASNPARMNLTQADHDWEIHGRHLLHVRPDADKR